MPAIIQFPRTCLTSLYCWTSDGATIEKRLRADVERERHELFDIFASTDRLLRLVTMHVFDTEVDAIQHAQIFREAGLQGEVVSEAACSRNV